MGMVRPASNRNSFWFSVAFIPNSFHSFPIHLLGVNGGSVERYVGPGASHLHPHSVKVTIFSEAERELPGKEMVWNMGLTTATVPRGCPNGFVFFKDVYHFE